MDGEQLRLLVADAATQPETATFRFRDGRTMRTVEGLVRCVVEGSKIRPCVPLETVLTGENRYERAVVRFGPMVSMTHGGERDGIVVELHRRAYMPLRFCPLCGVELATTFPATEAGAP